MFTFTPKQRRIVQSLWTAMEDGYGFLGQDMLLGDAERDCSRVRDLFRGHPAWGTMIVSAKEINGNTPGCYRLVPPPERTEAVTGEGEASS